MAPVILLSTRNLSRSFGGLHAVEDVDFDLDEGDIRAIIGPNGAGKTTFVSLICGRIPPTSGNVLFRGEDITHLADHERARRGIGYTFQITSIFKSLSAFDNVALAAQRKDGAELAERVKRALAGVGLDRMSEAKAGTLAYGHQRLLELAMALALTPRLLILDEPTQGLSDSEIASFCTLVGALAPAVTVLLIEHNMDVVMSLARRITVFDRGSILAEGTPPEIRDSADVQRVYLGG